MIDEPSISIVTVIELMQRARDKPELRRLETSLDRWGPNIVHLDTDISELARELIRRHALVRGLQLADALIAASAIRRGLTLFSGNRKHFQGIKALAFDAFLR